MVGILDRIGRGARATVRGTPVDRVRLGEWGASDFPWGRSASGKWVREDTAFTVAAVFRAVSLIAQNSGMLPLTVYTVDEKGHRTPVRNDAERVIWDKPNPEVSRSIFWETAFAHAVLNGNSFLYVVPAPSGPRRPLELWTIAPSRVQVGRTKEGRKVYVIDGDMSKPRFDWVAGGDIVHVPGLGTDGLVGLSPLRLAREAMGLSLASEEYAARYLGNGTQIPGYLKTDQKLTQAQAEELSTNWEEHHAGTENAHRVAILPMGTEWKQLQLNPDDAQMLETRKFQVTEIARWFGLPPHLLGDVEKSTSWGSGLEEQNRVFLGFTLQPWLTRFEQTISDELLRVRDMVCAFDTTSLTRGRLLDQVNAIGVMVRSGFVPEAVLERFGMDPIAHTGLPPVTLKTETAENEEPLPGVSEVV